MIHKSFFWIVITFQISHTYSKSLVNVHIPFSLHNRSGEDHKLAHYGLQHPQGSLAAYVYGTDQSLCDSWNSKNGTAGYPEHVSTKGLQSPFFLLVEHASSECTAVTQARHAQAIGAAAILISETACRCSHHICMDAHRNDKNNQNCLSDDQDILVNDGSAGDVTIPSVLLYRMRGDEIRDTLRKNQPVWMEITWGLKENYDSTKPSVIHYNLWTTPYDPLLDLDTYRNIRTIANALDPHGAQFQPRYSIVSGDRFDCTKQLDTNGPCDHLCTNQGRYCALHRYDLSGNAIVTETLRRLCIWQDYGTKDTTHFWDYILHHMEHCTTPQQFSDPTCIQMSLEAAKVDSARIQQCMVDSGGLDGDESNHLLETQLSLQAHAGILQLPALVVDNRTLDEPTSFHLWEGLCRRFWSRNLSTTPDVCFRCGNCPNVLGCLQQGHCVDFAPPAPSQQSPKHHSSGWKTFLWITVTLAAIGGAYYYYKRSQDSEGIRGGLLTNYFQLSGEEM
jgi:hypothetical protein